MRAEGSHAVSAFSRQDAYGSPDGDAVLSMTGTIRSWSTSEMGGLRVGAFNATTAAKLPPLNRRENYRYQDIKMILASTIPRQLFYLGQLLA